MKKLALLAVLLFSGAAAADSAVIAERPHPRYFLKAWSWAVDADLGRAWVNVIWEDTQACDGLSRAPRGCELDKVAVRVEGLSYDAASRRIVHDSPGAHVVCATVSGRRLGKIRSTGDCSVRGERGRRMVSDGSRTRLERVVRVLFEAGPAR